MCVWVNVCVCARVCVHARVCACEQKVSILYKLNLKIIFKLTRKLVKIGNFTKLKITAYEKLPDEF